VSRLLALLFLVGATGPLTTDARAWNGATAGVGVVGDSGSDRTPIVSSASAGAWRLSASTTAAANTAARGPDTRLDAWLDQLWWTAFAGTALAYVLVLGAMGLRRWRGRHSRPPAWAVPDVPVAAGTTRHVRPHL
jgi:hypothetical protein